MRTDRPLLALLLAVAAPPPARADAPAPPPDLVEYVRKEDRSFAWKLTARTETDAAALYEIDLTSQTWHEITWTHKVQVFVPKGKPVPATAVLWNQGGTPNAGSTLLGQQLAGKIGAPVVFVYGIPNQPLLGGKREDALIAETFVRYLETKDSSWPLLFPMVKSLARAMDAVQAFARQELKADVKDFVVTGASKRGWTSWLTAATGDKRVKAIAPLVFDTLNLPVQMKNQVAAFGKPSEMIRDYVERKLVPVPDTPEAQKLWAMIDPWVYRERLTLPKMLINGANDPYWPLDALNSYWDDLKGEKYVLYVPNAGHDLRERDKDGKPEPIPTRAVNTLAAFAHCQVFDRPMPALRWEFVDGDPLVAIKVAAGGGGKPRFWRATSDTRDFRSARWVENPPADQPRKKFEAFFWEAEYEVDGLRFTLSTQVRILEAKK